jgi:hypothetical protein
MLGLDSEIGTSALRLWVGAGSAALLVVCCGVAFYRQQAGSLSRAGLILFSAVLGAAMTWAFLDLTAAGDRLAERRALELQAEALSAPAMGPGSPLSCLDGLVGESIEAACEKWLFASPASVASASSYVAARLALFSRMAPYTGHGGADLDVMLTALRRSLETDRFGFLAHALAIRDGCTSQNCKALAPLRDASRVRANLGAETLDHYVEHYQEIWAKASDGSTEAGPAHPGAAVSLNAPAPRRLVNIDFPSAASIPPISIMNPEPSGPVLPGVAAAAAAGGNPKAGAAPAPRRAHKQAASLQATPQRASSGSTPPEPVWPEPVPAQPPQSAAAPVQLNPPSPGATPPAQ